MSRWVSDFLSPTIFPLRNLVFVASLSKSFVTFQLLNAALTSDIKGTQHKGLLIPCFRVPCPGFNTWYGKTYETYTSSRERVRELRWIYNSWETCPVLCWEIIDKILYLILLYRVEPLISCPKPGIHSPIPLAWYDYNPVGWRNHIDQGDKKWVEKPKLHDIGLLYIFTV